MSKTNTQRLFLAVKPNAAMVAKLCQQMDQLRTGFDVAAVNWSQAENLHLTLQFMGDVESDQLERLKHRIAPIVQAKPSFSVSLTDVVYFPSDYGRFVVIKAAPNPLLDQLVSDLNNEVEGLGHSVEKRPYRGHITLGRLRRSAPVGLALSSSWSACLLEIGQVVLFQSTLSKRGAEYVQLDCWDLLDACSPECVQRSR